MRSSPRLSVPPSRSTQTTRAGPCGPWPSSEEGLTRSAVLEPAGAEGASEACGAGGGGWRSPGLEAG